MIKLDKLLDVEGRKDGKRLVQASLIADTKQEVIDNGVSCSAIVGLNDDDELAFGSDCLTTDMDFGMLGSTGAWKF